MFKQAFVGMILAVSSLAAAANCGYTAHSPCSGRGWNPHLSTYHYGSNVPPIYRAASGEIMVHHHIQLGVAAQPPEIIHVPVPAPAQQQQQQQQNVVINIMLPNGEIKALPPIELSEREKLIWERIQREDAANVEPLMCEPPAAGPKKPQVKRKKPAPAKDCK